MKKTKEKVKEKKIDTESKIKELTELLQRVQADFENYKKRVEKEKSEFVNYAKKDMILKLLPILDNFELALKNKEKEFHKGVELIYAQIVSILEKEGVKTINPLNEKFDPFRHEALLTEKSDKEDIVLEVFQKGYALNDKVIRHARVKVGKS